MSLIPINEKKEIAVIKNNTECKRKDNRILKVMHILYEFFKFSIMIFLLIIIIANFSKIKQIPLLWGFKTFYENVFVGLMGFGIAAVLVYYVVSFAVFWIVSIIGTLFTPIKKK